MHPRKLVFITLLLLCHQHLGGQTLTNAVPPSRIATEPASADSTSDNAIVPSVAANSSDPSLPDDPEQEMLPIAQIEPAPAAGLPVKWKADRQTWIGHTATLYGVEEFQYRNYVLSADKVVYDQASATLEAEGHLRVVGGPEDVSIQADRGDMQLNMHTARFFNVSGSLGVRRAGRSMVYSTSNSFVFSGRVLLQTGEGKYRIVDGTMTNCRLPKPDWQVISHFIDLQNGVASTTNARFKFVGVPIFFLPYLRHPLTDNGRESGLLLPAVSNSSVKGYVVGEQVYWAISRSMDMVVGAEYFSRRGWAPNGDFRYKGPGIDHLTVRWNGLLDRGFIPKPTVPPPTQTSVSTQTPGCSSKPAADGLVNQGGADITALGRKDLSQETHVTGIVEYLSCYAYRLSFDDSYSQAISSEVASDVSLTHAHNGFVSSVAFDRFQSFASSTTGDEVRIIHMPGLRFDVLDRPLGSSPFYAGLGSSLSFLNRSEPHFHARNLGRLDIYPHLSLPLSAGGWNLTPEVALRNTFYSVSQNPDLTGAREGAPTIRHELLDRSDVEASVDLRAPALERDFSLSSSGLVLRHVIEPEFTYRYVTGIGEKARNVVRMDTTDIATNVNEAGISVTQRFYVRSNDQTPCVPDAPAEGGLCPVKPREWASWQIAQNVFLDSDFGGAIISARRNVFDSTLDMSGIAFLTSPRNLAPITSRLRFEAIDNLRIEWDLDYDPKAGQIGADNIFAGYSWGRTTVGFTHALLNAVDENGSQASTIQSQQVQPYLAIGKPSGVGFNVAANGGYDFVLGQLQYAGAEASYNWNCCGLSVGYRRFVLGSVRDETQYLYSFTIANFGSVGDISRTKSVFRDPALPPAY
jgi:LPS-assembly protein